jgi:hypothetical protein
LGRDRYGASCPISWSIITKKETTKAKTISCSSLSLLRVRWVRKAQSAVESGSVAYSNITAAPHEYFDQTGTITSRKANRHLITTSPDLCRRQRVGKARSTEVKFRVANGAVDFPLFQE